MRSALTGKQLLGALALIVLATAVVPPVAAWQLNARRVEETRTRASVLATTLRAGNSEGVLCGPGQLPEAPAAADTAVHHAWVATAALAPVLFAADAQSDAWGHCFLFDAGARVTGTPAWLLSAGANGVIDTPRGASSLQGDDIGVVMR